MPVILSFGRLRQEDSEFDTVSLGYRMRPQERGRKMGGKIRRGREEGRERSGAGAHTCSTLSKGRKLTLPHLYFYSAQNETRFVLHLLDY